LYIANSGDNTILKLTTEGDLLLIAGNGAPGFNGDYQIAMNATLNNPSSISLDSQSNLYVADTNNNRIRKIDILTGFIMTLVGNGDSVTNYEEENILATSASLNRPTGVCIDTIGNIYIAEAMNHRIRFVSVTTNIIKTIISNVFPHQIFLDNLQNIFFSDVVNSRM
jgi:sugar lactone lactonase YvrE